MLRRGFCFVPAARMRGWLVLLIACGMLGGIRGVLEKVRRQDEINFAKSHALHRILRDEMWMSSEEVEAGPFGRGMPLQLTVESPSVRVAEIPGARIGAEYQGWTLKLRFSRGPAEDSHPESIVSGEIIPPPNVRIRGEPTPLWWTVEYLRATVMLLAMVAWTAGIILILGVRGVRHQVSRWCLAAALVSMFAAALAWDFQWDAGAFGGSRWFDSGAAMAFVALVLRLIPSRRRVNDGRCRACGYDLTGNISGVCPECGTPTARHLREIHLAELTPVADRLVNVVVSVGEADGSEECATELFFNSAAPSSPSAAARFSKPKSPS